MKKLLIRKISAVTLVSLIILGLLVVRTAKASYEQVNPLSYIWTYNPVVMYWSSVLKPFETYWGNTAQFSSTYTPYTSYSSWNSKNPRYTSNYSSTGSKQINVPTHTYVPFERAPINEPTHNYAPFSSEKINVATHEYVPFEKATVNVPIQEYVPYEKTEINIPTHTYEALEAKEINVPTQEYTAFDSKKEINVPTHTYTATTSEKINVPTQQYVPFTAKPVNVPTNTYVPFSVSKVNVPTNTYVPFRSSTVVENTSYSNWGTNSPTDFGIGAEPLRVTRSYSSPLPPIFADTYGSTSSRGSQYAFDIESDRPTTLTNTPLVQENTTIRTLQAQGIDMGDVSEVSLSAPLTRADLARIVWSVYKKNQQSQGKSILLSKLPIIGDVKNNDALYQTFVEVASKGLLYMPNAKVEHGVLVYADAKSADASPVAQILQSYYKAVNKTPATKTAYTYTDMKGDEWYATFIFEAHAKQFLTPTCAQRQCASGALNTISKRDALNLLLKILQS